MAEEEQPVKQSKWSLIASLTVILGILAAYFFIDPFQQFIDEAYHVLTSENEEKISEWVSDLGALGPLFIILTMVIQMFLFVIPSPLLMVVSVLAYGPVWGVIISVASVLIASTIGYWIGRYLGVVTIYKLIGERKEKKLETYMERYGFWAVVVVRLSPLLSNDAASFVAGILQMGYTKFILATFAGITPLAVLIAYFGENNDRLKTGLIVITAISLVALIIYILIDKKKNRK
ncbi:MAG: TVP38/TMEM64 family protein [Cyclobacteriaceae bacterium]